MRPFSAAGDWHAWAGRTAPEESSAAAIGVPGGYTERTAIPCCCRRTGEQAGGQAATGLASGLARRSPDDEGDDEVSEAGNGGCARWGGRGRATANSIAHTRSRQVYGRARAKLWRARWQRPKWLRAG